jgi:hypothetical protein
MQLIHRLLDALESEIDALPTTGRDEKLRALDGVTQLRKRLESIDLVRDGGTGRLENAMASPPEEER